MANRWLKARQTKYAAYASAYVLVVITAVVVANILGNRYNKSLTQLQTNATAFHRRPQKS